MVYDKPIIIQQCDEETEQWSDLFHLHARVNRTAEKENFSSGASRDTVTMTFEVQYFSGLKLVVYNTQAHRVVYDEHIFNIINCDDYMERHSKLKITGELYV